MKTVSRDHFNLGETQILTLTADDIARFFGITTNEFTEDCRQLIVGSDFRYRRLNAIERDNVLLHVLKRINASDLTVAGKEGKERWERGWNEILKNFKESDCDINYLVPQYIRPKQVIRLDGDYAEPQGVNFELDYYNVFRRWLFWTYLGDVDSIFEFGCGTGYNLIELAKIFPKKELHGLDWVSAPKEILRLTAQKYGYNVTGHVFDMFEPDETLLFREGAAILAIGALEQLGTNFEPFIQFVLRRKPALFVHVDSVLELYDENTLFDYFAVKFDRRRNYLEGYLTRLRELEKDGIIEILKVHKSRFGSLFHDGYSLIVWRPKT